MADGLGEFGRIARYFAPLASGDPGAFGLLDDVALIGGTGLVVTADAIVEGIAAGATGWIVKPVSGNDLIAVIKKVLPGA